MLDDTFLYCGKESVVEMFHFAEFDEVKGGFGTFIGPEIDSDIAKGCFDQD